jgi:hypothetical protein
MTTINIGNVLNRIAQSAITSLFSQGEIAQLTYSALTAATQRIEGSSDSQITISYPVGYRADKTTIQGSHVYLKEELLQKHNHLAQDLLPLNGLLQIVTTVEALLSDSVRAVVTKYPKKLGQKRTISLQMVLESKSLEEIHSRATDEFLNELSYKSPREFAENFEQLLSINLLECPAFHKYMEVKASRDIHIHNRGVANETYCRKSGTHARVDSGKALPVTVPYFLESYEYSLQLNEWLEVAFHEHWHSSEYEERKSMSPAPQQPSASKAAATPAAPALKKIPVKKSLNSQKSAVKKTV